MRRRAWWLGCNKYQVLCACLCMELMGPAATKGRTHGNEALMGALVISCVQELMWL
jgi:hypothetical protein